MPPTPEIWTLDAEAALKTLASSVGGLSSEEAAARLAANGPNTLKAKRRWTDLSLFLAQFKSPIIIILVCAAILSLFLDDATDAIIILTIVAISGLLGFWQERGAAGAVEKLMKMVETKGTVARDGKEVQIPLEEFVPGDVTVLSAGSAVPGDCLILESKDLFANEAALTGETFPVEKTPGAVAAQTPLAGRTNMLFLGTHVVSGKARAMVAATGLATEFGKVSARLRLRPQETDFERGIRRFGMLLMEITLLMMTCIFALNVLLEKPVLDSFMFSLALAVGLTPQLLPAIISINLATGARRMAERKVIVRRLSSIENFGSMNLLCSDKTGTLTDGTVRIHGTFDPAGNEDESAFRLAYINGALQTGFVSPIDEAIKARGGVDIGGAEKLDEAPYDFVRKRLSVLVRENGQSRLVTKGALLNVLDVCATARLSDGRIAPLSEIRADVERRFEDMGNQGYRCLGLAEKDMGQTGDIGPSDESDMVFRGFLTLWDPPKPGVAATIEQLARHGVDLKVITGDNRFVAANLARGLGLSEPEILTGREMHNLSDEALRVRAARTHIFAEVEPNQKEDIVVALKQAGYVVGFMGDGINDASAIRAADVGLSVEGAVDVAKEAADIVLLEQDLGVLERGVAEGRKTFANTLKYVFMATSANFGNMFSMAGASLFLPFLPLLPMQVLLTNLLTDLPEMTIATDNVDPELVEKPRKWDIAFIRDFMLVFGPLSSIFDYMTFGVLLLILGASEKMFQTGWFVESVVSAALIVLVVRTKRTILKSRPSRLLLGATLAIVALTVALPFSPLAGTFGFEPLPLSFLPALLVIVILYVVSAEWAKRWFYRRQDQGLPLFGGLRFRTPRLPVLGWHPKAAEKNEGR